MHQEDINKIISLKKTTNKDRLCDLNFINLWGEKKQCSIVHYR